MKLKIYMIESKYYKISYSEIGSMEIAECSQRGLPIDGMSESIKKAINSVK